MTAYDSDLTLRMADKKGAVTDSYDVERNKAIAQTVDAITAWLEKIGQPALAERVRLDEPWGERNGPSA